MENKVNQIFFHTLPQLRKNKIKAGKNKKNIASQQEGMFKAET